MFDNPDDETEVIDVVEDADCRDARDRAGPRVARYRSDGLEDLEGVEEILIVMGAFERRSECSQGCGLW